MVPLPTTRSSRRKEDRTIKQLVILLVGLGVFLCLPKHAPQATARYEATQTVVAAIQPATEPIAQVVQAAEVQPATAAVEPSHPNGCEHYVQLVSQYDWDVATMLAIAKAESGCRPAAKGDTTLTYEQNGRIYGYSVGLFQVRVLPGRESCDSFDPQVNVDCAYRIYKSQGYNAWTVYKKGTYKKFLTS